MYGGVGRVPGNGHSYPISLITVPSSGSSNRRQVDANESLAHSPDGRIISDRRDAIYY